MRHGGNILSGVSTLDLTMKNSKSVMLAAILLLLMLSALRADVFGGHSTLDIVDPSFNPNIQTNSYANKWVNEVQALPDGKILALGSFNTYNRVPVGKLVRLNADGSLDTGFNTQTISAIDAPSSGRIFIQSDGKLLVYAVGLVAGGRAARPLIRLNADGTFDPTFNYPQTEFLIPLGLDLQGRLLAEGNFTTPNGTRRIARLNEDGSLDNSFNFVLPAGAALNRAALQGNKVIVSTELNGVRQIYRLNEDGSVDNTFTPLNGANTGLSTVQPDNKILYRQDMTILRLNENGSPDGGFQPINFPQGFDPSLIRFTGDGRFVVTATGSAALLRRFLPDGTPDPSFTPYAPVRFASYTIQTDNSMVIGDGIPFAPGSSNNFVRITPGGALDPTFNPGGNGFQTIQPGVIQAIETYPNGKILLGGKFDLINNVPRIRIARLNADGAVDNTFQINTTSGSGNYFSDVREIYQIRLQPDGKLIVVGWFAYVLNGANKINFVRLNADGSIDPTFNLNYSIFDYSQINIGGQNRFATYGDGRLMVGNSKADPSEVHGPIRILANGTRDTSFGSVLNNTRATVYIHDVALQPDGKVVVSGQYPLAANTSRSFYARLNSDGTMDSSFPYTEESGLVKSRLALLPNGKILIIRNEHPNGGNARLHRLNSNGSVDTSFNALTLADPAARLNALLVLPNGKIFVGGRFTLTVGGQPAKNLLQLDADGNFSPTLYNINEEVFALAADADGRVLVGGGFTVISAGGNQGEVRSFTARLTDSTPFDYDGDGKSDISVFRPSENKWYILQSSNLTFVEKIFGAAGDIPTPSDFDGDGKTDPAVFRPSVGDWWYLSSLNGIQVNVHWGQVGDIPRPSDFDGDGKTDFVVYRPSNSVWYRLGTTGATDIKEFGIAEDHPLVGDFDGDGKGDLAVFRPSTGDWWYAASASNNRFIPVHWGQAGDVPVPGDYDADGKTDFVVYRPGNGGWYILRSGEQNYTILQFGLAEDKPVSADYDGDGKADVAVWRPSTGVWYLLQTTSGFGAAQFGLAGDMPTENAFLP